MGTGKADPHHALSIERLIRFGAHIEECVANSVGDHGPDHFRGLRTRRDVRRHAGLFKQGGEIVPAHRHIEQDVGFGRQLFEGDDFLLRQRMDLAHQDIGRHRRQALELDVVLKMQVVGDRHVDLKRMELVHQDFLIAFDHLQLDFVEGARKAEDDLGRNHCRERLEASHPQGALDDVARIGGDFIESGRPSEHVFAVMQDQLADGGQSNALGRMAHEQLHAQFGLDMGDRCGDRGRGDMDLRRRCGDAAMLRRCDEILHLAQGNAIEHVEIRKRGTVQCTGEGLPFRVPAA
ncbi:hypothetical protein D9M69_403260 [compost metagenome]